MYTKFYKNRLGFVEGMTKNWCVFFGSQCKMFACCGERDDCCLAEDISSWPVKLFVRNSVVTMQNTVATAETV